MTKTKLNIAKVLEVITVIYGVEQTEQFIKALMEDPMHYKDWIVTNFQEWGALHISARPFLTLEDEERLAQQMLSNLTEKIGPWHTDIFLCQIMDNDQLYLDWLKEHREEVYNKTWLSPEPNEDDY